ncbi:EamA family transporter [Nigerium massiliense]|uniref:EamA family transporter n=1 Tax=Nigerium massiliense TaxID=1522317 RepID=UPI00069419FD|nr:EamA family transporter [Nigerium massiliense]
MTSLTTKEGSAPGTQLGWILLSAVAPVVWGTTYIVTTHVLPGGHPIFAAFMRTLPPGLIALAWTRQLPRGAWWWRTLVLGGLNMAVFFPLLFVAAQRLPGGVAATLGAVQPLIIAVLAVWILREPFSGWRSFWGVAGVAGIAMVVLGPEAALEPVGVLAGLGGAASMATGVVLTKKWGRPEHVSAMGLAGWQLTAAGLLLAIPALLFDGIPARIDAPAWAGYAWLGLVGALVSYTVWFAGIRHLSVTPMALLGLLSPLTAALLGVLLAGETLAPLQLAGFGVALTAMVAGQLNPTWKDPR